MTNYVLRSNNNTATHNAYTQVGADMGVFALAAYLMFLTTPFKRLRKIEQETLRTDKRDARFYYLSVGLQASLVGYMVSSFFASVGYLWNVYYLVGYAIGLHRLYVEHLKESAASNAVAPEASHDPSPTSALV
jgi:O-antigen ligase